MFIFLPDIIRLFPLFKSKHWTEQLMSVWTPRQRDKNDVITLQPTSLLHELLSFFTATAQKEQLSSLLPQVKDQCLPVRRKRARGNRLDQKLWPVDWVRYDQLWRIVLEGWEQLVWQHAGDELWGNKSWHEEIQGGWVFLSLPDTMTLRRDTQREGRRSDWETECQRAC